MVIGALVATVIGCSPSSGEEGGSKARGTVDVFALPGDATQPFGITAGPDGNVWFTEAMGNHVGKMSVDGELLDRYPIPSRDSNSQGLTTGYDDRVWITECNPSKIAAITTDGEFTEYPTPSRRSAPCSIVRGPDEKLWFASFLGNLVGSITSSGRIEEFSVPTADAGPYQVASTGSEEVWVSENTGDSVASLSAGGNYTEYRLGGDRKSDIAGVAVGDDGSIWFAETTGNLIGRLIVDPESAGGRRLIEYPMPRRDVWPYGVTLGPDGDIWFSELGGDRIGRIEEDGTITEWKLPDGSAPRDITVGPDENIWVALSGQGDEVLDVRGNGRAAIARLTIDG